MPQKPNDYYRPVHLAEALRLLAQPDVLPLAGGTKLLAAESGLDVAGVVDLQALGLDQIEWEPAENRLRVGAMVRLTALMTFLAGMPDDGTSSWLQVVTKRAGPNTYRHAATMGGTIASRLPDSELLAALLLLEAGLMIEGGEQVEMPLAAYLAAVERPSGLITQVTIPWKAGWGCTERVARTPADYAIVSVACWQPDGAGPRLAATGIDKRPLRLAAAEAELQLPLTAVGIEAAAAAAVTLCQHPGDFRGDAAYRAEMTAVLTRRVLRQCPAAAED